MTSIKDLVIDCAVAYVVIKGIQYYGRIKYAEGRHDEKLGKEFDIKKNVGTIEITFRKRRKDNEEA